MEYWLYQNSLADFYSGQTTKYYHRLSVNRLADCAIKNHISVDEYRYYIGKAYNELCIIYGTCE